MPAEKRAGVFALIAGGGTGGHIYPALAIADALVRRGHDRRSIRFAGSKRALEARVVPAAGYEIDLLPGRGIRRQLSLANVGAIAGLLVALARAVFIVRRLRPSVVISVGGYAAAPAALAAVLWRVPLVLAESNAVPGAVNRLVGRAAKASAVSWPRTPLPRSVVTGNPVRPEIVEIDRSADGRRTAKRALGMPDDRPLVAITSGSLGARSVNRAVAELSRQWAGRDDVSLYHVVGKRDWEDETMRASATGSLSCVAVAYEERMPLLYGAADVVVCRSGATTSAELAVAGIPSVLVPLPGAPGDHQTANAQALGKVAAAVVLPDADCDWKHLANHLDRLLADEQLRADMGRNALSLGKPDAARSVAELAEHHARSSS